MSEQLNEYVALFYRRSGEDIWEYIDGVHLNARSHSDALALVFEGWQFDLNVEYEVTLFLCDPEDDDKLDYVTTVVLRRQEEALDDRADIAAAEEALKRIEAGEPTVPWEQLKLELGLGDE